MTEHISLAKLVQDFIDYKKSIGYQYESAEYEMRRFLRFAEKEGVNGIPDRNLCLQWVRKHETEIPVSTHARVSYLREFGKYLFSIGYDNAYILPGKIGSKNITHVPYFFTDQELYLFFKACDSVERHPNYIGRELVLPVLFRFLYCCGVRTLEASSLLCANVHLTKGYVDIIHSKGPKSRRIFLGTELTMIMETYEAAISSKIPNRSCFFPRNANLPYNESFISRNFRRFWCQAFTDFKSEIRPRAYDFRHHWAFSNINRWVKEGKDVDVLLPYLMRYMGHSNLKSTCYYIHFVPEFFVTFTNLVKELDEILPEVHNEETI